mmetsp:Transcript_52403/g.138959  ORF Transcript_52403/g.138959 Transcript_52403/m.138959 type:complete len:219 (-) Transcript_52403:158-814(-)
MYILLKQHDQLVVPHSSKNPPLLALGRLHQALGHVRSTHGIAVGVQPRHRHLPHNSGGAGFLGGELVMKPLVILLRQAPQPSHPLQVQLLQHRPHSKRPLRIRTIILVPHVHRPHHNADLGGVLAHGLPEKLFPAPVGFIAAGTVHHFLDLVQGGLVDGVGVGGVPVGAQQDVETVKDNLPHIGPGKRQLERDLLDMPRLQRKWHPLGIQKLRDPLRV